MLSGFRVPGVRLDRPGAALVGAAAMLVFRVLSPAQAAHAVDLDTIVLLFGMMVLTAYLTRAGFFEWSAASILRVATGQRGLLAGVVVISGALSALLVNDTICLMLTPLLMRVTERAKLDPKPYLFALCMAANAGSAATFTGNPQNMLIGLASGEPWLQFAAYMALPAVVSLGVVFVTLVLAFRRELDAPMERQDIVVTVDRRLLTLSVLVLLGVVVAFLFGLSMAWSAFVGAAALLLVGGVDPREPLEQVDFVLLAFFSGLFVVMAGVQQEGWSQRLFELTTPMMAGGGVRAAAVFSTLSLVASNLFSNVPFVMLAREWVPTLPEPKLMWQLLALSSTLAGNLTLIGSVANLIVFEGARGAVKVSFWEYLKVGLPATLVSLTLGIAVLLVEHSL